ncbi:MAG: PIN domain-containing protein [Myxococcales bacterium]|nr:PIN domain-containing protein [Myxococcales bacterium]
MHAYVDTSCLVAIALGEADADLWRARLAACDGLWSADLLNAELRATLHREGDDLEPEPLLQRIGWVRPNRRLDTELAKVLAQGYLRGADLHHVATALFLAPNPVNVQFLTCDGQQRKVAASLGFAPVG